MIHKAVLFDLDNTLINRNKAFRVFTNKLIDQFIECRDEKAREAMIEFIRVADRNGYRKKSELFGEIKSRYPLKNPDTSIKDLLDFWFSEFFKCTVLMDSAIEVLEAIKDNGYLLGLITNGSIRSQNGKLDFVKIREYFDDIIVSDEVRLKKPDQQIFTLALDKLGVAAEDSWYVGDHPVNDVYGARQAGLTSVWFEGPMEWDSTVDKPEYTIGHLRELLPILDIYTA